MDIPFLDTLSGAFTTDAIIILAVFFLFALYSVRYGKSRSIAAIISLYIGMLLFLSFPYLEEATLLKASEAQVMLSQAAVFLFGAALVHAIVSRSVLAEYPMQPLLKYLQVALLSLSGTALLFAFAYHTLPLGALYNFDASIDNLFSSQYFFWWLVLPLAALFITTRR